jgi:serine/threonine-protein kinase
MLEMSRRTSTPEAAEAIITQGFGGPLSTVVLRLFPEACKDVLDVFEAGPIERYRATQPAVVATTHLARALIYSAMGNRQSATACYDSARLYYQRIIRSNPQSAYVCMYHGDLGLACAGLGRCEEAIREGEDAVRMVPLSKDAIVGAERVMDLAEIYVKCDKYEAAINQIETLLSVPSVVSSGLLRADPIWDPIRNHPRFKALLDRYAEH